MPYSCATETMFLPLSVRFEHRTVQRRSPAAHAECFQPPFERGNAPLQHVTGRIGDAAAAVSLDLEIEERCSVRGAVECVGYCLIDRNGNGLRGFDFIAGVDWQSHLQQSTISLSNSPEMCGKV